MAKVVVQAGVCGYETIIDVKLEDRKNAKIEIESQCSMVKKMAEELSEVDCWKEVFSPIGDSVVFQIARKHIKHAACPVPTAILKGIEVACKLALPRDVLITITK